MILERIDNPLISMPLRFAIALAFTLAISTVVSSQDSRFVEPPVEPAETLGGLKFGGEPDQAEQLESIDGEIVDGPAESDQQEPEEYGPIGGYPSNQPRAEQRPALTPQGESVLSESEALPNQYEGELIYPDWMGKDTSNNSSTSRRTVQQSKPEPASKPLLSNPRLRIDGMKAIESTNRDFDSNTHEVIRERYADGSVKIVRTIAQDAEGNYYNDGGWLMYDRQQRPIASGTFVRGTMEGNWERVHESGSGGLFSQMPFSLFKGPYLSRASFVRNKIDGVWAISDESGKPICAITFENGTRNGPATWFYPSGKKMREATFKNGVPHGFVMQWDQQGKIQRREQFVDGRKVLRKKTTHANQTLASERVFRDRKLSPQGVDNWWAAKPATYDRDGEEVQYGPVAEWYPNRQPKMTGRYVEGRRDGLFTWWHPTHNKKAEGNFSRGKRVGLWRYWHESGMKRSEGKFEDDVPVGVWRTWNSAGQVVEEKDFSSEDPEEEVIAEPVEEEVNAEPAEEITGEPTSVTDDAGQSDDSDDFTVELEDQNTESDPVDEPKAAR